MTAAASASAVICLCLILAGLLVLNQQATLRSSVHAASLPLPASAEPPPSPPPPALTTLRCGEPGSCDVLVNGQIWLQAGTPSHVWSLKHPVTSNASGTDELGSFDRTSWLWRSGAATFETAIRSYAGGTVLVFEQCFHTAVVLRSRRGLVSEFPSFRLPRADPTTERYFIAYDGDMSGQLYKLGTLHAGTRGIGSGLAGTAPLVLFDATLSTTLVLSPLSSFMTASQRYRGGSLSYGLLGSVRRVPAGFSLETVLVTSSALHERPRGGGIRVAMLAWGDVLLRRHGRKQREDAWRRDLTLSTLGYGTQNGAYYYYNAPRGKTYEDVILGVAADARLQSIPYRYWLADSWWYEKHSGPLPRGVSRPGVMRWEPLAGAAEGAPSGVFPRGLRVVRNATGWAMMGHNRYWSSFTPYARQHGGPYDFVLDASSGMALPTGRSFWDALFAHARANDWGLVGYEQDWMDVQTAKLPALTTNATLGRTWLLEMGEAAHAANISIQYASAGRTLSTAAPSTPSTRTHAQPRAHTAP